MQKPREKCVYKISGSDDGSVETKCYSVVGLINLSFHLDYLVINFSK